jgi:flagellar hook-length control protein FliK
VAAAATMHDASLSSSSSSLGDQKGGAKGKKTNDKTTNVVTHKVSTLAGFMDHLRETAKTFTIEWAFRSRRRERRLKFDAYIQSAQAIDIACKRILSQGASVIGANGVTTAATVDNCYFVGELHDDAKTRTTTSTETSTSTSTRRKLSGPDVSAPSSLRLGGVPAVATQRPAPAGAVAAPFVDARPPRRSLPLAPKIIVAFGQARFNGAKGCPSAPTKRLYRRLSEHYKNECRVVDTNEHNTTATCHVCGAKLHNVTCKDDDQQHESKYRWKQKKMDKAKKKRQLTQGQAQLKLTDDNSEDNKVSLIYSLKACPTCVKVYDRDDNASWNMAKACWVENATGHRPPHLSPLASRSSSSSSKTDAADDEDDDEEDQEDGEMRKIVPTVDRRCFSVLALRQRACNTASVLKVKDADTSDGACKHLYPRKFAPGAPPSVPKTRGEKSF